MHVFSLPVSWPATENVALKNFIMGMASLLKGVRVIFEQYLWVNVDGKLQNCKNRMSFFMHTLYLNIDYILMSILMSRFTKAEWMNE